MAVVRPFYCIRPDERIASQVAALPYDVFSRKEAYEITAANPLSFLNIDRAETQFPLEVDIYDGRVYEKAKNLLEEWIARGTLLCDCKEAYFIYELTMDGRSQTGIAACCSIDDYISGVIKKHENTREDKETDRIRHVDATNAHTGPIFMAYRSEEAVDQIVESKKKTPPIYDFISEDGIGHKVWRLDDENTVRVIEAAFDHVPSIYIADGHHRAASAVKVGLKRREENGKAVGNEPYHYFLSVLFPDNQLLIMPYNRVIRDINGLTKQEFLDKVSENFQIVCLGSQAYSPDEKGMFGMFLDKQWYQLKAKPEIRPNDVVKGLDVSILHDYLLSPVLGIGDPRTDKRIDFVGGIRGLSELERRVAEDMKVAFSLYPTSIEELFKVADAGMLMPPKSTWFEPKLRSGLFIHSLT